MYSRNDDLLIALAVVAVWVMILGVITTFLSAIARVLRRVEPENRRMGPGQVWLNLIPVFNLVWVVVTVERVAESLRAEFASRGLHGPDEHYGRRAGLRGLVLLAIGLVFLYLRRPPPAAVPTVGVLALIHAIVYWRQMTRYADRLKPGTYAPPPTDEGW